MRRLLFSLMQLALVGGIFLAFFSLTPWLGCRPISELPSGEQLLTPMPPNAVCFTNNHGHIAFHTHGLISQEPLRFAVHVAILIILFGALLWSIWPIRGLGSLSRSRRVHIHRE
jgi:hypothetical protein